MPVCSKWCAECSRPGGEGNATRHETCWTPMNFALERGAYKVCPSPPSMVPTLGAVLF